MSERAVSVASPFLLLALWEAVVRVGWLDPRFFPAPSAVGETLWVMTRDGELGSNLGATVLRLAVGFALGAIPGVLLGLVMGLNRWVRALVNPIVAAIYPIPKIAILPLLMLIFGLGETTRVVVVAVSVFFVLLINTTAGVMNVNPIYLDVGRNLHVSRAQFLRTIALPAAAPVIFAGVRLAVGISLVVCVAAEMVSAQSGLGYLLWRSWQVLDVERMYAALLVVSALGLAASYALDLVEQKSMPWNIER